MLVELKKGELFCDSNIVAKKFEIKHNKIIITIEKLLRDLKDLRVVTDHPKTVVVYREYRGQKFKTYLMNREFFSLLSMRFRTREAFEWQVKFNDAFYAMEKRLLIESVNKDNSAWQGEREQGKLVRRQTTDVIKDFVEYATKQGSKNARMYYKHITSATYKALDIIASKQPKVRESLNGLQLAWLTSAEHIARQSLKKHMNNGEDYHAIYVLVKQDLELFSKSLMLGNREELYLNHDKDALTKDAS